MCTSIFPRQKYCTQVQCLTILNSSPCNVLFITYFLSQRCLGSSLCQTVAIICWLTQACSISLWRRCHSMAGWHAHVWTVHSLPPYTCTASASVSLKTSCPLTYIFMLKRQRSFMHVGYECRCDAAHECHWTWLVLPIHHARTRPTHHAIYGKILHSSTIHKILLSTMNYIYTYM